MKNVDWTNNKKFLYVRNFVIQIFATMLIAAAVKCFSAPNHISPAGATGVATLINYLTGLPIGTTVLAINVPLLLIAYKKLGKTFVFSTLQVLLINMFVVDALFVAPPVYAGDPMLASIFGGVLNGSGIGLIFLSGATSGGSDIINKLMHKKYPYYSTGQLVLAINSVIIMSAAVVYGQIESSLYGLVMSFTSSKVIDAILYGSDLGKSCMIVTKKPDEVSEAITDVFKRGATLWEGEGAYKRAKEWVLVCVVRKQEFPHLKQLIRKIDPAAFIIVSDATQIIGGDFKPIDAEEN